MPGIQDFLYGRHVLDERRYVRTRKMGDGRMSRSWTLRWQVYVQSTRSGFSVLHRTEPFHAIPEGAPESVPFNVSNRDKCKLEPCGRVFHDTVHYHIMHTVGRRKTLCIMRNIQYHICDIRARGSVLGLRPKGGLQGSLEIKILNMYLYLW